MIETARKEFDTKSRSHRCTTSCAAGQVYPIPSLPTSLSILAYWSVIGNYGLYRTETGGSPTNEFYVPYWWIDTSKAPINRPA